MCEMSHNRFHVNLLNELQRAIKLDKRLYLTRYIHVTHIIDMGVRSMLVIGKILQKLPNKLID